jgi:hypothetical protein
MTLDRLDVVFYTLAFVVPGFILHSTFAMFVPRRDERTDLTLLRYLTWTSLNYAIWSWLVYLVFHAAFFTAHPVRSAIAWATIIFISPVVLGLLLAFLSQKEVARKALQRVGLNPIHEIPTAWDYKFSTTGPAWVLVTLKDGSSVAGLFGSGSFASSDPSGRDLYVQEVFRAVLGGQWERVPRSEGILIQGEQIKHVEFLAHD